MTFDSKKSLLIIPFIENKELLMKLELDCSWNKNKNKAKVQIIFDYRPKSLFNLPISKIHRLKELAQNSNASSLDEIKELIRQYPKSPYLLMHYYNALRSFKRPHEAADAFNKMVTLFPDQVFTKCMLGEIRLKQKEYKRLSSLFNDIEVLKGAFPKRRIFFFEEALCFHNLWGCYHFETGNKEQAEKHKKLFMFILNTAKNLSNKAQPA
ncbi:MAG: hypothetical protein S4CHLAM20_10860 [Chlamydiia bacterium]|nr:hypothetical protein [Chlamydiia bacterium]